jgi:two-component system, NtrC family, response regulator HydG
MIEPSKGRVLVVDDHVEMARLIADVLVESGYAAEIADRGRRAIELIEHRMPDLVITDLRMEEIDGLDLLDSVKAVDPTVPVIVMTAFAGIDGAIEAIRRGAHHYITKPFELAAIVPHVERALVERTLARENRALRRLTKLDEIDFVGESASVREVLGLVDRLADARTPVLIRGESGCGKELVARALHFRGVRQRGPFVPVNCSAIPEAMLESELFGHLRGAFTGAEQTRRGLFVEADRGTLFLDEIGDMPPGLQAKILRVLEDSVVRPVGADAPHPVDVRVVAATHQDLEARIEEGRFRQDLLFRLDVMPIRVPSLRERPDDIPLLADHFIRRVREDHPGSRVQRISPELMEMLKRHDWPGNVRELRNLIERLVILCDHAEAKPDDIQGLLSKPPADPSRVSFPREPMFSLRELEEAYISFVMDECGGNKTRAAEILGIDVSTLHRRTKRDVRSR